MEERIKNLNLTINLRVICSNGNLRRIKSQLKPELEEIIKLEKDVLHNSVNTFFEKEKIRIDLMHHEKMLKELD